MSIEIVLKLFPVGFAVQLACRGAGGLTPDHYPVARRPDILDGPVQVWDYLPQGREYPR